MAENVFDEFTEDVAQLEPTTEANKETEITPDALSQSSFLKIPEIGKTLTFVIDKIVRNPVTEGTNKTTKEKFHIGVKKKDGTVVRYDIITTNNERLTITSWELFYKIVGPSSDVAKLAKEKNTFKGIKVSITKNFNGNYAMKPIKELKILMSADLGRQVTDTEAEQYKTESANALKEQRLFTVVASHA